MSDNSKIKHMMKQLLQSKNFDFAKLLELSLILTRNKNIVNKKEYINVLNNIFISRERGINYFQKVICAKIMLTLLSHPPELFEDKEKNELKNIHDILKKNEKQIKEDEILKQLDNNKDKNLDDIIINIIKKFLQLFCKKDVAKAIKDNKNKYLEFFSSFKNLDINENIKDELSKFLSTEENAEIKNYFNEIDLITNIKKSPKILEEIYDYIKYKFKLKEKKKLIKELLMLK